MNVAGVGVEAGIVEAEAGVEVIVTTVTVGVHIVPVTAEAVTMDVGLIIITIRVLRLRHVRLLDRLRPLVHRHRIEAIDQAVGTAGTDGEVAVDVLLRWCFLMERKRCSLVD